MALEALEGLPDVGRALLPDLVKLLEEDDGAIVIAALRALGRLGPQAVSATPAISRRLQSLQPSSDPGADPDEVEPEWAGGQSALRGAYVEALESIQGRP